MANPNNPRGLIPYRSSVDGYMTGGLGLYRVPSGQAYNLFVGDPVIPLGTSDANGIPDVGIATAGATNNLLGPMVSIAPGGDPVVAVTRDLPVYRQNGVTQYILVAHDPNTLFEIQDDGSAVLSGTATFSNANLVAGAGSTFTGYSGWQLLASTVATTPTFQLRILRLLQQADNAFGVNAKWLVRINLHVLLNLTGI
jgi:hypothetical protein